MAEEDADSDGEPPDYERQLSDFRNQWQQEISTQGSHGSQRKFDDKLSTDAAVLEQVCM